MPFGPVLHQLTPSAPLWRAVEQRIDADALLTHDLVELTTKSALAQQWFAQERKPAATHRAHDQGANRHGDDFHALALTFDGPIHWTRLVFIVDGLEQAAIERSLAAFLGLGAAATSPVAA